jgi:hypothetical protein
MGKRNKQRQSTTPSLGHESSTGALPGNAGHPPAKNPTLLAVSIALFALWFAFLLVTALAG